MSLKNEVAVLLAVLGIGISLMVFVSDLFSASYSTPRLEENPQIGVPKIDKNLTSQDLLTKGIAVLPPAFVPGFREPFAPALSESTPITQSRRLAGNRVVESLSALGCRVITPAETRKRIIQTMTPEKRNDPLAQKVAALHVYPGAVVADLSRPDWEVESPESLRWRREATKAVGEYLGVGYLLRSVMASKKVDDKLELTIYFDLYDTKTAEVVLYVVGRSTRKAGEKIDIAKMACETGLDVALKKVLRQRPEPVEERVEKLIGKLKSDDGKERVEARKKLAEIGEPAVEPLIEALRQGLEPAAGILGQIGDERAIEPLIEATKNPDLSYAAGEALAMMGKPAEKALFAAIREMEKGQGAHALEALAKIAKTEGVDLTPLVDMLSDESTKVRHNAAGAFLLLAWRRVKEPRAVPPLIQLLKDSDTKVRITAAATLCHIRGPRSRQALIDALQDKNPGVRYFAAGGLAYIGGKSEIGILKKIAQDDPDSSVRLCAKLAIREIEARLTGKKVIYSIPISHSDFNRIKVGMSKEEVKEILGEPLEKTERVWHYTLPRPGQIMPPIIRIDFDQDGKVIDKIWEWD